jgi:hypothetical protein
MPRNITKTQSRNAQLRALWANMPDAEFERLGFTRAQLFCLQDGLSGYVVLPGMPDYNTDRKLFNPVFDSYPLAIVYCESELDVAAVLQFAQTCLLGFQVRSGGHCTAGFSSGSGILLDVSHLKDCTVDRAALTATVGCGCPFKKLYDTLRPYGLHVPAGECEDVCVGGFVQGGGYGFTSVTFGMNCDNVIDLRVMLATGQIVSASETVNRDLWWAMRGGTGGNFGVLLSVRYALRPLGDVFGWAVIWPLAGAWETANATGALMFFQANYLGANTNPLLNIQVSLCFQPGTATGAPSPSPSDAATLPYLMIRGLYVGDAVNGQAAIAPLCALPGAIKQWTETAPYDVLNVDLLNKPYSMPFFPPHAVPYEDKVARYVARPLAAVEWRSLLEYFKSTPNPYSYAYLECYGGAINAYPSDKSAFVHRDVLYNAVLDVFWLEESQRIAAQAFLEGWAQLVGPMGNGRIYQNYPRLGEPNYAGAYWGDAQAGLYAVKCKYDETMAFRFAQQVSPLLPPIAGLGPRIILPDFLQAALDQPIVYCAQSLA